jgi:hypothetical protein
MCDMTDAQLEAELENTAHRLSGAVYGTILATTVVAATGGNVVTSGQTLLIVVVTSAVFWMAHVYSETLGARIVAGHSLGRARVLAIARGEWPMLQSCVPVAVPLVLGWMGVLDADTAATLAVVVGVGALFTYGVIIGRREHLGHWQTFLHSLTTGSFGLVVLALKLLVH